MTPTIFPDQNDQAVQSLQASIKEHREAISGLNTAVYDRTCANELAAEEIARRNAAIDACESAIVKLGQS